MTTSDFTPEPAGCGTTPTDDEESVPATAIPREVHDMRFSVTRQRRGSLTITQALWRYSSGNQAGEAIFVLVNRNTNDLLPMGRQDPIYQRPGVCATC